LVGRPYRERSAGALPPAASEPPRNPLSPPMAQADPPPHSEPHIDPTDQRNQADPPSLTPLIDGGSELGQRPNETFRGAQIAPDKSSNKHPGKAVNQASAQVVRGVFQSIAFGIIVRFLDNWSSRRLNIAFSSGLKPIHNTSCNRSAANLSCGKSSLISSVNLIFQTLPSEGVFSLWVTPRLQRAITAWPIVADSSSSRLAISPWVRSGSCNSKPIILH